MLGLAIQSKKTQNKGSDSSYHGQRVGFTLVPGRLATLQSSHKKGFSSRRGAERSLIPSLSFEGCIRENGMKK
jgi:hypothetical protein